MQRADLGIGLAAAVIFIPLYVFRLTDELAASMRIDSMTKLWNRVAFDEFLETLCPGDSKATTSGAVVVLDLDGFKTINDKQGHPRGDKVLKEAGYALSVELSPFGRVARIGGDEFGVIVDELKSTEELEDALVRFLDRAAEVGDYFGSPLSASIGVYYIDSGTSLDAKSVYKAADSLMYESKRLGKRPGKRLGKNQLQTSLGRTFSERGTVIPDLVESAKSGQTV